MTIVETSCPWEDFSTPSRDLRLLIAVDVVRGFPDRVARRPERFAMPAGKPLVEVKAGLVRLLDDELGRRRFAYERSDGSSFSLSLADVVGRAPAGQAARMRRYRPWFHERKRPPRG